MKRALILLAVLISPAAGAAGAFVSTAAAAWPPDGAVLSMHASIVVGADGRGGIFGSNRSGLFPLLYHLDGSGERGVNWPLEGIELVPGMSHEVHDSVTPLAILPDGTGGMYLLAREKGPFPGHGGFWIPDQYFVHRRTGTGNVAPGWTMEGVALETPLLDPRYVGLHPPSMVADGAGGVLVAWLGTLEYPKIPSVVVQRVSGNGACQWGEDGITLHAGLDACTIPALVADGRGGAFVFWGQWNPAGTHIHIQGQHVTPAGELLWGETGRVASSQTYDRVPESIPFDGGWVWASYHTAIGAASDGEGGAILAWAGARGADLNVMATRIAADGSLPWDGDMTVCGAPGEQATIECKVWHHDGVVIGWRDGRKGADVGIFAQALDRHGRAHWNPDGVAIGTGTGERGPVRIVNDGGDGTYFVWADPTGGGRVYAHRLLHSGRAAPGWPENGTLVSRLAEPDYGGSVGLDLVDCGDGTAIAAWTSWNRGSYAMQLTPRGVASTERRVVRTPAAAPLVAGWSSEQRTAFGLHGIQPQPVTSGSVIRFSLSESGPASLAVFDVSGRCVWSRDAGSMGPGEHRVSFGAVGLPAGMYLVRLRQGDHEATARAIVVH